MKEEVKPLNREEMMSALFANMVLQQTNLALMFLGRVPHPETGEHTRDLDMAQMFIDQLEMLEAKTKGNLSKQEEGLLRQSLTAVHMAYVDAANEQKSSPQAESKQPPKGWTPNEAGVPQAERAATGEAAGTGCPRPDAPEPEDTRKKFSKKY